MELRDKTVTEAQARDGGKEGREEQKPKGEERRDERGNSDNQRQNERVIAWGEGVAAKKTLGEKYSTGWQWRGESVSTLVGHTEVSDVGVVANRAQPEPGQTGDTGVGAGCARRGSPPTGPSLPDSASPPTPA